jgi:hypothetical protein
MGATHFPNEDTAEGRKRNGTQRARLQFDAHLEYRRRQGADGGDQGVAPAPTMVPLRPYDRATCPDDA